ncbi:phosphatidylethanolamine-binding protein 4-like [Culicoides brevitarsis]|uniref:phosphatidylethanolamine-binding protein 4-like n=1 Tax=Culicoides brevitarsis TaxID=469753 RepID=UPI00307BCB7F
MLIFALIFVLAFNCYETQTQAYVSDGCNYNFYHPLMVTVPSTGFTISEQTCGLLIPKDTFKEQPFVYYIDAKDNIEYTVLMVDPDHPSTLGGTYYVHWILANIPGYILKTGLGYNVGTTIKEWTPPSPAECSGSHRYIFLVYEQHRVPLRIPIPADRLNFSLNTWLRAIEPYGSMYGPVASTQFVSAY